MPIYEYECQECGHVFEVTQGFRDEPIKDCPVEGCAGHVKKLFSPPAIIFKGSGFHVNDYGRGGNGSRKPAESCADSGSKGEACKACANAGCATES